MKRETLITALDRYARPSCDGNAVCVVVREAGREIGVSVWKACEQAADLLRDEDLHAMKFKALVSEMKRRGMGTLYERLMHEEIDDALKN